MDEAFNGIYPSQKLLGKDTSRKSPDGGVVLASINTYTSTDATQLNSIMATALSNKYSKVTAPLAIDSAFNVSETSLTGEQIINGTWLKENYDRASVVTKLSIQFQSTMSTISRSIASSTTMVEIKKLISSFETTYLLMLSKLGVGNNLGKIEGTIVDQTGYGVPNLVIGACGKIATTDNRGKYKIEKISLAGGTNCSVQSVEDAITGKPYTVTSGFSTILAKNKNSKLTSTIKYDLASVGGTLKTKSGQVIANAKITFIVDGKKISTTTDSKGIYTIKDLGYKRYSISVTNSDNRNIPLDNSKSFTADRSKAVDTIFGYRIHELNLKSKK